MTPYVLSVALLAASGWVSYEATLRVPADAPKTMTDHSGILPVSKDLAEALKNLVEAGGIIVGGFWTWMLFIKKREKFPRAKITHAIVHRSLPEGRRLLHLDVKISNTGEVLLTIVSGKAWVQQVLPPPRRLVAAIDHREDPVGAGETEYRWPLVARRENDWSTQSIDIEPGEDHQISYDLFIDCDATTVAIYTYFKNAKREDREIGWPLTSVYDLPFNNASGTVDSSPETEVSAMKRPVPSHLGLPEPPITQAGPKPEPPVTVTPIEESSRSTATPQAAEKPEPPLKQQAES